MKSNYEEENRMKGDKKISIALISTYVILSIQYFILIAFDLLNTSQGDSIQLISKLIVGLAFLYSFPVVFSRKKVKFIVTYVVISFIFLINYLFFIGNRVYLSDILFPLFFVGIPSFIYTQSIHDLNVFKNMLKKSCVIVFFSGTLLSVLNLIGIASIGLYSMTLSYYMLFPLILYIDELFDRVSAIKIIMVTISLLVILTLGSRGAILCAGVFTFLRAIKAKRKITYKLASIWSLGLTIFLVLFFRMNEILLFLYNSLARYGIRSRSIAIFLRGDVYLTGRDKIYETVLNEIMNKPIFGLGLTGDRVYLNGGYVHNFYIEIVSHFGLIIGIVILTYVTFLIIRALSPKIAGSHKLVYIWFSLGFVHLMISSSYLIDFRFWIFLGLLVRPTKSSKIQQEVDVNV